MKYYPQDESDFEDAKELGTLEWQLEALKMNPDYLGWGVYEDYMTGGESWNKSIVTDTWKAVDLTLDDFNEVVNFYFEITRDSVECPHCEGSGYNPATAEISDTFYDFNETGKRWCDKITQDEVDYLFQHNRLWNFKDRPTAQAVNGERHPHDAINRWMLIEYRATKAGVYGKCEHCHGTGIQYTEPQPHLALTLWLLHPRKGASRGWRIEHVEQSELPQVIAFLQEAALRNANRFSKLQTFVGA